MLEAKGNNGYNAATDVYEDLVKAGVIDPTKVTRTALQNAASVATLLLTSDALIAEKPKKDGKKGGGRPRRRLRHVLRAREKNNLYKLRPRVARAEERRAWFGDAPRRSFLRACHPIVQVIRSRTLTSGRFDCG